MRKPLVFALLTLAATLISVPTASAQGGGFFNFRCEFSHSAAQDPIVAPGDQHTEHLHDFIANRSTNADSTRMSMLQARTTCALSKDTSGYWVPALLDRSGNHVAIVDVARAGREARIRMDATTRQVRRGPMPREMQAAAIQMARRSR